MWVYHVVMVYGMFGFTERVIWTLEPNADELRILAKRAMSPTPSQIRMEGISAGFSPVSQLGLYPACFG